MTGDEQELNYQRVLLARQIAPYLPWNQWGADMLGPVIMQFIKDNDPYYKRWSARWFENFQFLYGNQSGKFERNFETAVNVDPLRTRAPSLFTKSQTNITRTIVESLTSFIFGTLPDWDVESSNESSSKANRAKYIVQSILDAYFQRLSMDVDLQVMANCFPLYGCIFSKIDWDDNAGTILDVPIYDLLEQVKQMATSKPNAMLQGLLEVPTPYLDSKGQEVLEKIWTPRKDASGKPIIKKTFSGDIRHTVKTPFEIRRPIGSYGMHKDKYIQEFRIMDYDEWMDEYQHVGGKTKFWNKFRPLYEDPASFSIAMSHFLQMQLTTPPVFSEIMKRADYSYRGAMLRGKVLVVEHWDKPHQLKWPKGRRVIVTNGMCTHITVPNYRTGKMNGWHPYAEAQWMRVAPNSYGPGPVNDSVIKNRELNQKDSLVATASRRNLGGALLYTKNSGFDPTMMSGEPGRMLPVKDLDGVRFLHDDLPISPIIPQLRESEKADAYEMSGAGDSLRGDRSVGAGSGYQARQYSEREEKRLTPAKTSWDQMVSTIGEKIYVCLRHNVVKLDDAVIGFMQRSASGRFTPTDVMAFLSTPIEPGIDISVKKDSMAIKSKASMQATLQELAKGPFGKRLEQDAYVMDEYLKYFDAEKLRDRSSAHRDRAQRENSYFSDLVRLGPQGAEGTMAPVVLPEDDDDIHLAEHAQYEIQNTEELLQNPAVHFQWIMHQETHRIQSQEKKGAVPPGSTVLVPQMYGQVMQTPNADGTMVAADQQQRVQAQQQQQQMQAQQAAQQSQTKPGAQPQAPSSPSPAGSGAGRETDPNAPSANTPQGARQGGPA